MNPHRVMRIDGWSNVKGSHPAALIGQQLMQEQEKTMNPWKVDAEGWSFEAKDLSVVSASKKRKRAFTGHIQYTANALPAQMQFKSRMIKMGIGIFIAADLFLAFIFLSSVL